MAEYKLDIQHLQKVQRTIRKAGNIFPNEQALVATLEETINKVQDEEALNLYYHMAQYLKQRLKELSEHLDTPQPGINEALADLTWSINYLQWLVSEQQKASEEA
jgi:ferritin